MLRCTGWSDLCPHPWRPRTSQPRPLPLQPARHRPSWAPMGARTSCSSGARALAGHGGRRALSRFRRRHRRQLARPRASASRRRAHRAGRQALARSNLYESRGRSGWPSGWSTRRFADKVFFSNSGAEACEGAIKTARRYHYVIRQSGALAHHHLQRRLPRPHAGDDRRRRPAEIPRRLRPEGRGLRPGAVRRHRRRSSRRSGRRRRRS